MHLYVHVPFCARRCSYCDFAIAVRRTVPVDEYVRAVEAELAARQLGGSELATVYLGGGTPSKLGDAGVARLLSVIRDRFPFASDAEVTLECNPEDASPSAAAGWVAAGVNRLSLGVQSFEPAVLSWMHRTHDVDAVGAAVHAARGAGIENVSVDLIFALPDALERDWSRDLDLAVALSPDHISAYGLTVEPATPLGRWSARGDVSAASEDRWSDEFLAAHAHLAAAGFEHYEVSNYARPGARSRHNQSYWTGASYIGIGPSAHGYDGTSRRWNRREYVEWRDAALGGHDPVAGSEHIGAAERVAECVYLGLRSTNGLELEPGDDEVVDRWVAAEWARKVDRHGSRILILTAAGWQRLDALAAALTDFRSRC